MTLICVFILIGIGLRAGLLTFAWDHPDRLRDDSGYAYERLSTNMLEHRIYSLRESPPYLPSADRTPLYPSFISVARLLLALDALRATAVLQIVLSVGTMLLLYLVAREVGGESMGILALGIFALEPLSAIFASIFVTETLFAFLLTLSTWLFFKLSGHRNTKAVVLIGVCLGIALGLMILCKPSGVPPAVVLFSAWVILAVFNLKWHLWKALIIACLAGLIVLFVLAPWLVRNQRAFGRPVLNTWTGLHIFQYYAVHIAMDTDPTLKGLSLEEAGPVLAERHGLAQVGKDFREGRATELELSDAAGAVGVGYVQRYPLRALGIHIRGCLFNFIPGSNYLQKLRGKLHSGTGFMGRLNRGDMTAVVDYFRMIDEAWIDLTFFLIILVEYGLIAMGIVSALLGGHSRQRYVFLLLLILAYLLLPGAAGEPRMRVPVMPLLCIFAAKGLLSVRPISLLLRKDKTVTDLE